MTRNQARFFRNCGGPDFRRVVAFALALQMGALPAWAWDARGHRIVTRAALEALPPEAPAWLREPGVRDRIAWQSNDPDRMRGTSIAPIGHENKPDHYLDIDLLEQFGLTMGTVPSLRYEYLRAMAISRHLHPEKVEAYDAKKDEEGTKEWPGFLPHAMAEHYAKLVSEFNTLRILEKVNDPGRTEEIAQARANVIYEMGILSHFVGDAAQPLHTTKHHHGWVGENPNGYTTEYSFHSQIDGGVLRQHNITTEMVTARVKAGREVDGKAPWNDFMAHIQRSYDQMEPLYKLEKSGELKNETGREFIVERLADGASTLSALYWAAYKTSEPTEKQIADYLKYDDSERKAAASAPAGG